MAGTLRVWDPLVRLLHWSLVLGFAAAWLTRHTPGPWHEWLGYAVLVVIAIRLLWGFAGGSYARFSSFVRPPGQVHGYVRQLLGQRAPRYIGHNPLGGWMVVALLLAAVATCVSGWLYTTDRFWGLAWVETLHDACSWVTIGLAALHLCGVVFASLHQRENLVAAMLHGRKRAPAPGDMH